MTISGTSGNNTNFGTNTSKHSKHVRIRYSTGNGSLYISETDNDQSDENIVREQFEHSHSTFALLRIQIFNCFRKQK